MHTSFEDLRAKNGHIYRQDDDGNWIWERPRTKREAGVTYSRIVVALALGFAVASPLIVAMIFIMT